MKRSNAAIALRIVNVKILKPNAARMITAVPVGADAFPLGSFGGFESGVASQHRLRQSIYRYTSGKRSDRSPTPQYRNGIRDACYFR